MEFLASGSEHTTTVSARTIIAACSASSCAFAGTTCEKNWKRFRIKRSTRRIVVSVAGKACAQFKFWLRVLRSVGYPVLRSGRCRSWIAVSAFMLIRNYFRRDRQSSDSTSVFNARLTSTQTNFGVKTTGRTAVWWINLRTLDREVPPFDPGLCGNF